MAIMVPEKHAVAAAIRVIREQARHELDQLGLDVGRDFLALQTGQDGADLVPLVAVVQGECPLGGEPGGDAPPDF